MLPAFMLVNASKPRFECPICAYRGAFRDIKRPSGVRRHAQCPSCGALERHRIQFIALEAVLAGLPAARMRMLHFAPEPFFRDYFASRFGGYETADLDAAGVDHGVDLQALPFADASYDFVFASHVLEHIRDDRKAIAEIRRVLRPGGVAVLPVPLVAEQTIEYPEPEPMEDMHVRAPGLDYYDRMAPPFARVEKLSPASMPERYQPFIYEDRTAWPSASCPRRPPMSGARHIEIVPVCYV